MAGELAGATSCQASKEEKLEAQETLTRRDTRSSLMLMTLPLPVGWR